MFVDVLPWWERCTYFILSGYSYLYMIFRIFFEGEKHKDELTDWLITPGWSWLGRYQDHNDSEWQLWRHTFQNIFVMIFIHVLLSQICFYFRFSEKLHKCVLLVYDVTAILTTCGIRVIIIHASFAVMTYTISFVGSIFIMWLMNMAMIYIYESFIYGKFQIEWLHLFNLQHRYQHLVTCFLFNFRLLSFAIEKIKYRKSTSAQTNEETKKCESGKYKSHGGLKSSSSTNENLDKIIPDTCQQKKTPIESCESTATQKQNYETVECDPSFLDLLFYSFYMPSFFYGPISVYRDFHNQIKASFTSSSFRPDFYDIAKRMIRIAFWAFFIDFQFHFLYYRAIAYHPKLIAEVPVWILTAIMFCQLHFYSIKYIVIYGFSIQIARFDGIAPIAVPRCFSWMYSMKDFGQHFDPGFYNFLKTYLYIPLGGSKTGVYRAILASSLSYLYIFFSHGAGIKLFIWTIGSYILSLQILIESVLRRSLIGVKLKSCLSPATRLRIKAIVNAHLFVVAFVLSVYFCFPRDVGWIFVSKMIIEASWGTYLVELIFFTAYIQNAEYVIAWYKHKQKERTDDESNVKKKTN